jgi:predicted alpha/beta hydrolase family esterase
MPRVVILPGNGAGNVWRCNWYGWLHQQLHKPPAVTAALRNMPDPVGARAGVWLPFMESELAVGPDTVVVGHSSGAAAAMRYAEGHRVAGGRGEGPRALSLGPRGRAARGSAELRGRAPRDWRLRDQSHEDAAARPPLLCRSGLVLVSAYTTDQGDPLEAASGYFDRPWRWDAIRSNAGFVIQFGSTDDPFLPWAEQAEVAEGLGAELHRFEDRGHFMDASLPELLEAVEPRLRALIAQEARAGGGAAT